MKMSKVFRRLLALVLVASLLLTANVTVFAAADEEYLSELRLVYAEDYSEAKEILKDTEFKDYVVLNENLNENTDEIGVWLAYKTTTNIEDAITDLSVMQMQGGYTEGNYQEMLKESYDEYLSMGNIYLQAIDYFLEAYDSGDYLAEVAYRQLNFYTVETVGKTAQKPHPFEGELLGDIFYEGIDVKDLATLFMQGNVYALQNIRSLLAMGVSYNEDGLTYVEKVAEAAAEMNADPTAFDNEDLDDLLPNISAVLTSLREQFKRLETVEKEFNWEDDKFTDEEIEFAEITLIATLMRDTEYLDGKSLYDFCKEYKSSVSDSKLYPLAVALNPGQAAMTKVFHFYDVIRYSISEMSPDVIEEKLSEEEEIYAEEPFNLYAGVDRSIFDGSFALTTAASRANEMNEYSLEEILFGDAATTHTTVAVSAGAIGLGVTVYALCRTIYYKSYMVNAADAAGGSANMAMAEALKKATESINNLATQVVGQSDVTYGQLVDNMINNNLDSINNALESTIENFSVNKYTTFSEKLDMLNKWADTADDILATDLDTLDDIAYATSEANHNAFSYDFNDSYSYSKVLYGGGTTLTAILYLAGGAMMLYSAITMGITVYNYYHPDYDDIPTAMVDMIETVDGDRFIKYDAVLEAEAQKEGEKKGSYIPGDLNAFAAQRWNALYYTKSYEAGKPLLADEFSVSNTNNKPKSNYAPVHRFGEVVCYDLNKYNFDKDSDSIYLSVKQSKNQKAAVADVPEVVGSIFANGMWLLIGATGALFGVGGTLGTQALLKKKRNPQKES